MLLMLDEFLVLMLRTQWLSKRISRPSRVMATVLLRNSKFLIGVTPKVAGGGGV